MSRTLQNASLQFFICMKAASVVFWYRQITGTLPRGRARDPLVRTIEKLKERNWKEPDAGSTLS